MRTSTRTEDEDLIGTEVAFGATPIGHVLGVVRDPLSHRVRRLITSYGARGRRVAVPMEWVVRRTPDRLVLGVGTRSLDDLGDWTETSYRFTPPPSIASIATA
jgi:PRC-barrel domain